MELSNLETVGTSPLQSAERHPVPAVTHKRSKPRPFVCRLELVLGASLAGKFQRKYQELRQQNLVVNGCAFGIEGFARR